MDTASPARTGVTRILAVTPEVMARFLWWRPELCNKPESMREVLRYFQESTLWLVLTWYLPWIFLPTQTGTPIRRAGIDMPARRKDQWEWKVEVNQRMLQALMIVNCISITLITYKCDANRSSNKSSQLPQQLLFSRPRLLSPESTTWARVWCSISTFQLDRHTWWG